MAAERTFVLVKPDGVTRGLTAEILSRFERRGLKIVALKMLRVDRSLAGEYYAEHKSKDFFQGLIEYITSGPSVAAILEGNDAVATVRSMMGATNPAKAERGTIRADFGLDILRNVIHGSDSRESAAREAALFFKNDEIEHYERTDVKRLK